MAGYLEDRIADDLMGLSDIEVLLKGHLWIENFLVKWLIDALPRPEHIDFDRIGFEQKVRLAAAHRIIEPEDLAVYLRLNRLRNHATHYLDRPLNAEAIQQLEALMTPSLSARTNVRNDWGGADPEEWSPRLKGILLALIVNLWPDMQSQ